MSGAAVTGINHASRCWYGPSGRIGVKSFTTRPDVSAVPYTGLLSPRSKTAGVIIRIDGERHDDHMDETVQRLAQF
jgi:hypothetical protein